MTESLERRRPRELTEVASSLEDARPGQVMILGNSGELLDRKAASRQYYKAMIPIALGIGIAAPFLGLGFLVTVAMGAGVAAAMPLYLSFRWRPMRVAWAQVVDGDLDAARATLEGMAARPPWRGRPLIERELGRVASLQGRHRDAAEHYRRAAAELAGRRKAEPLYWMAMAGHALALALGGDGDAARERAADLDGAPATPLFDILRQYIALRAAFADGDASTLEVDELYDWARLVLSMNMFGANLALMAWACDELGERDMAVHLLSEAPGRLEGVYLATSDPPLYAFVERAWERWGLADEHGPLAIP